MPDEAHLGTIERWITGNPWPLGVVLALAAVAIAFVAVRRDAPRVLVASGVTLGVAVIVVVLGSLVVTSAEAARAATLRFVEAAETGRVDDMISMLEPTATLHVARVENPGFPIDSLEQALDGLRSRYRIEENSITLLDAAPGRETVWVELACMTRTEATGGWIPSRWILEWRDSDGDWRVASITAMKIAGRVPDSPAILR